MKAAYRQLDAFHHGTVEGRSSVTALLAESAALQNSQDLFELYVFDHLQLTRCKARSVMGTLPLIVQTDPGHAVMLAC